MEDASRHTQKYIKPHTRIGWLADLESLGRRPGRLAELQDRLGIDTVWLESGRYHTAGYKLSDEAWQASPFQDWQTRPGLSRHRQVHHLPETAFPVLPGILAGADDTDLLRVSEEAWRLGIKLWGHMGLWSYGGMIYPEFAVRNIFGNEISAEEDRWGSCFCPSKPVLNRWLAACLQDCVKRYPLQGIELDHARFLPPASLPNLLVCACPDCIRQAALLGFDLGGLVQQIQSSIQRLRNARASQIIQVFEKADSLLEALDILMNEQAASRWFSLRALLLSMALSQIIDGIHQFSEGILELGIDVFPPSVSMLGGHQYTNLAGLDFFTGGFGIIGWERVGISACQKWASFFLQTWPECDESIVLSQLFRVFGYSGIDLPAHLDDCAKLSPVQLASLEAKEIAWIANSRPTGMPVYVPASLPVLGFQGLDIICQAIVENGLDGIIMAGLEDLSEGQENEVASALRILL